MLHCRTTFLACLVLATALCGNAAGQSAASIRSRFFTQDAGVIVGIDEAGRRDLSSQSQAIPTSDLLGIARDGLGRVWTTQSTQEAVRFDPRNPGPNLRVALAHPLGPIAIGPQDEAYVGDPTIDGNPGTITVIDPLGMVSASWATWGGVQKIVTAASGAIATVETDLGGTSRLRLYDAGGAGFITERTGCALSSALWAREGGGFLVSQLTESTLSVWSGFALVQVDSLFQTVNAWSTAPELQASSVAESSDGNVVTLHPFGSTGRSVIARWSATGVLEVSTVFGGSANSLAQDLALDGKGGCLVTRAVAHAPGGSPLTLERYDDELRLHWSTSLGLTTGFGTPSLQGDATGFMQSGLKRPNDDFDQDGLSNQSERMSGSDSLDPQDRPSSLMWPSALQAGALNSLEIRAPLDAGRPYIMFWTTQREPLALDTYDAQDLRTVACTHLDPQAPGGEDWMFQLSTQMTSNVFGATAGTLDSAGRATTELRLPAAGAVASFDFYGCFLSYAAGAPNDVLTVSRRVAITLP